MAKIIEEEFKLGMRYLAGAVHLITTSDQGHNQGLTATAVCSLTVDPPTLIACVNKTASAHDTILESGSFAVNVLGQHQQNFAQLFSDTSALDKRFSSGEWSTMITGAPVLAGSLCVFDCRLAEHVDRSTHTLFIGDVVGVSRAAGVRPLMYFDGSYTTVTVGE